MNSDSHTAYGVLVAPPERWSNDFKNIGDYIQSIASRQFYPHVDCYVNRENICNFASPDNKRVKCILNGWWMWHPENWPPSEDINPLPISMHISPIHSDDMFTTRSILWFKQFEPIGCRDYITLDLLRSRNIEAYYSGCLTLTLGRTYKNLNPENNKRICFIDPYLDVNSSKKRFLLYFLLFKAPYTILKMSSKDFFSRRWNDGYKHKNWFKNLLYVANFYKVYSSMFSNRVLRNAEYYTHMVELSNDSHDTMLKTADSLLKKYSESRYIVTSRIHAGLPCLGIGTPVIFVTHESLEGLSWNAGRLKGLIELLRVLRVSKTKLIAVDDSFKVRKKIDCNFMFSNKLNWIPIAAKLETICSDFIKSRDGLNGEV